MKKIAFLLIVAQSQIAAACPFCDLGARATQVFTLSVMGLAVLGFIFFFIWSLVTGHYRNVEGPKHRILDLDNMTTIKKWESNNDN